MKKFKNNKGITLVALIITIIVLLILAVVAISSVKDGGILAHAKNAQQTYKNAADNETAMLESYLSYLKEESAKATNGPWIQKGKGEQAITFTNGKTSVKLGDVVKYSADGYNGEWKALGVENGQLLLISEGNITDSFPLRGLSGYNSGIEVLDSQCKNYLNPQYASKARSLRVDDINRITGFDPKTYESYGNKYEYRREGEKLKYKLNDGEEKVGFLSYTTFNLQDGSNLGETLTGPFINECYSYDITNAKLKEMLNSRFEIWLASPYNGAYSTYISSGMFIVDTSQKIINSVLWDSGSGNLYGDFGIRVVVALNPDIELEKNGENEWNIN